MAKQPLTGTTAYSAQRFAHPFFVSAPVPQRTPINGSCRMLDWRKAQLGRIPTPANGGQCSLSDFIGVTSTQEIEAGGEFVFHALGHSGVNHATEAEGISELMGHDFAPEKRGKNPAFLLHLGDVVYARTRTTTTANASTAPSPQGRNESRATANPTIRLPRPNAFRVRSGSMSAERSSTTSSPSSTSPIYAGDCVAVYH
jgi:hypothetical protein